MNFAIIAALLVTVSAIFQRVVFYTPQTATPLPIVQNSESTFVFQDISTPSGQPVNKPIKASPTATKPVNSIATTRTPTPTPTSVSSDTQPPVFEYITGPADGSTVNFRDFCFPMKVNDNNPGTLMVRYSFDNSGPSDWNQNYAPCYQNVSNGFHFFIAQAKDAAGNTSEYTSRNFTVAVPVPPTSLPVTPLPTNIVNVTPIE